jgi:hypothetical protein
MCDGQFRFRPDYNASLELDLLVQIITMQFGETLLIGPVS